MTVERRRELADEADSLAVEGEFGEAADTYVRAGFEEAGTFFGKSSHAIELRMLYKGCLCYRLAGQKRQYRSIARIGIEFSEEYAARMKAKPEPSHPPDRARSGVWHEFVGDFRLVGKLGDAGEAYDRAKEIYQEVGDPSADFVEGPIKSSQAIFGDTVLHAGEDDELIDESRQRKLTEWVEYKREHLPELIDSIVSSGTWHDPVYQS